MSKCFVAVRSSDKILEKFKRPSEITLAITGRGVELFERS